MSNRITANNINRVRWGKVDAFYFLRVDEEKISGIMMIFCIFKMPKNFLDRLLDEAS
jgi:hypothetical protein